MFQNREEAGLKLAAKLATYAKSQDAIVFAIPRGGVVVGTQVAKNLSLPLSVVVIKKLGAPGNPELAVGAVAAGGVKYIDWDLALRSGVEQEYLDREIEKKKKEVEERIRKFRIKKQESGIRNKKTIILTDDGIATGATTLAAIRYLKTMTKKQGTITKIILAVPVIAKETYNRLQTEVDKIVVLEIPEYFGAVGEFYRDFPQVSDEEVINILKAIK